MRAKRLRGTCLVRAEGGPARGGGGMPRFPSCVHLLSRIGMGGDWGGGGGLDLEFALSTAHTLPLALRKRTLPRDRSVFLLCPAQTLTRVRLKSFFSPGSSWFEIYPRHRR